MNAFLVQDWAVRLKLHAPGQTVVEGHYDGAGGLTGFKVTPVGRRADVVFAGCVKTVNGQPVDNA